MNATLKNLINENQLPDGRVVLSASQVQAVLDDEESNGDRFVFRDDQNEKRSEQEQPPVL